MRGTVVTEQITSISDIGRIIQRRKWTLVLPAVLIFLLAAVVALSLPKQYRSTATILIEAQEVPNDYVKANITSFADQRLQTINQRIMGTPKLLEMINRFKLYADKKQSWTMDEIVDRMRNKDIKFSTISADVVDPRSGRPGQATIAFSLSFLGPTPEVAQQVANELSSLYMEENLKVREQQSQGTSNFLADEMRQIQENLADIGAKIAIFKQNNINALPELYPMNMQVYEQVDRDIRQMTDQLRALREKEGYLNNQLSNTPSELVSNDKETLRQLRVNLSELKSKFSDEYPDVIKAKMQIKELEQQLQVGTLDIKGNKPDNPAYIALASQLAGTKLDIESIKRQMGEMTLKRDDYQKRIFIAPKVEESYKLLIVERDNLQQKFDDMSSKALEAKVAHGMEKEQLGERFTLVDPARAPEKPTSPNIPAIMLIGLILGIGSGVGLTALKETGDDAVYDAEALNRLTNLPVLVTIPVIVSDHDLQRKKRALWLAILIVLVGLVGFVFLIHFYVMDLDVIWARLARKLAM
jgi:polysaccharide chain length determinant protein (PEP-CTERM system associated)